MAFTLANMSVHDTAGSNTQMLMPKLSYRFRVSFENFGVGSTDTVRITQQVVDVTRPQVNFPEITIPVYNSTVYLAGKPTWNPVTLTVRDDASNFVSKLVGQQIQQQFDFANQASAVTGASYKFVTVIEMLDGGNGQDAPVVQETWKMFGCYIQDVNYNQLNYGNSEAMQITMTIRFDNAIHLDESKTGTVGGKIGRAMGDTMASITEGSQQ
jgi:hypothetical protein